MFIALGGIFYLSGSLDFSVLNLVLPGFCNTYVFIFDFICISIVDLALAFMLFGVVGKSAQIGLHL